LAGKNIVAYEKLSSGALRWDKEGVTDGAGMIKFDLPGLGKGAAYVLYAYSPFGDGKDHYSDVFSWRGPINFALTRGELNAPDRVPPQVSLLYPGAAMRMSIGGLRVHGLADDDESIDSVRTILTLPSGAVVEKLANYNHASKAWFVDIGPFNGEAPGTVRLTAKATDTSLNATETTVELSLVDDRTAPRISIESHGDWADVPMGGFVVRGKVLDDTPASTLSVQVSGGGLTGAQVRNVEVAAGTGDWALALAPENSFSSLPLTLTLTARDGAGNSAQRAISLRPVDDFGYAWSLIQRTGFGARPGLLAEVKQAGVLNYLLQQVHADSVDDSSFEQRAAGWVDAGSYLATDYLRRAAYSRRQLLEVMTWFWDNHFNTYFYAHGKNEYERQELAALRAHALGNFRDLLAVSAKSPAMLYTLDGVSNMRGSPNENYARELLELHTLGVDGGYAQSDVENVARAFTGWTVKDGQFYFDASRHDGGQKLVLGTTLAAWGGLNDGEQVLDMLARHASTAKFICRKLVTLFVSDQPVDALVQRCASTFQGNLYAPDQMVNVVWTILSSPEFKNTSMRGNKVKTPMELVLGAVRQLGGETDGDDLALEIQRLGMGLFVNPVPTGYAEAGDPWVSTSALVGRTRFAARLLADTPAAGGTRFELAQGLRNEGIVTAEGVAGRMLEMTLGPTFTRRHWQLALDVLTEGGVYPYFHDLPDAEQRLRRLGMALMVLPEFHYQ
jgi:hypothetical protein